jgi:hypothetical protein
MKAGKVDRRTGPSKARDRIVAVIAADWGGPDAMTGAGRLMADRIGVLGVRLMLREQRQMREAAAGIDDPSSDKHSIALFNSFTRALGRLEEMRAAAGARKDATPSLEAYLSARSQTPPSASPSSGATTGPAVSRLSPDTAGPSPQGITTP